MRQDHWERERGSTRRRQNKQTNEKGLGNHAVDVLGLGGQSLISIIAIVVSPAKN